MKNFHFIGGAAAVAMFALAQPAMAASFINGGFEDGTANGWNEYSSVYRGSVNNTNLTPQWVKDRYATNPVAQHSAIVAAGTVDPVVGSRIGDLVHTGNYSYRVEDTTTGGYASLLEQTVINYTDSDIFFAWKAVLDASHGVEDAATIKVVLQDLTTGDFIVDRTYNAASGGSGVDERFELWNGYHYTPEWQIEHLVIDATLRGHDFLLSVLAADCSPTAHRGYVYLDGFGSYNPDLPAPGVPEPASWAMLIAGFGLVGGIVRRRRTRTA